MCTLMEAGISFQINREQRLQIGKNILNNLWGHFSCYNVSLKSIL